MKNEEIERVVGEVHNGNVHIYMYELHKKLLFRGPGDAAPRTKVQTQREGSSPTATFEATGETSSASYEDSCASAPTVFTWRTASGLHCT